MRFLKNIAYLQSTSVAVCKRTYLRDHSEPSGNFMAAVQELAGLNAVEMRQLLAYRSLTVPDQTWSIFEAAAVKEVMLHIQHEVCLLDRFKSCRGINVYFDSCSFFAKHAQFELGRDGPGGWAHTIGEQLPCDHQFTSTGHTRFGDPNWNCLEPLINYMFPDCTLQEIGEIWNQHYAYLFFVGFLEQAWQVIVIDRSNIVGKREKWEKEGKFPPPLHPTILMLTGSTSGLETLLWQWNLYILCLYLDQVDFATTSMSEIKNDVHLSTANQDLRSAKKSHMKWLRDLAKDQGRPIYESTELKSVFCNGKCNGALNLGMAIIKILDNIESGSALSLKEVLKLERGSILPSPVDCKTELQDISNSIFKPEDIAALEQKLPAEGSQKVFILLLHIYYFL